MIEYNVIGVKIRNRKIDYREKIKYEKKLHETNIDIAYHIYPINIDHYIKYSKKHAFSRQQKEKKSNFFRIKEFNFLSRKLTTFISHAVYIFNFSKSN